MTAKGGPNLAWPLTPTVKKYNLPTTQHGNLQVPQSQRPGPKFHGNQYTKAKGWTGSRTKGGRGSQLVKSAQNLAARLDALEAALTGLAMMEFGDVPGHAFHGNQYTYEVQYAEDHDAMSRGEYKTAHVKIQAKDEPTANLHAAQMSAVKGGIPTSTKLISTRLEARLADHSGPAVGHESVKPGDKIVDASKLGRPQDDFTYLHGATITKSEQALGSGKTDYVNEYGKPGTLVVKGGTVTVERPSGR